MIRYVRGWMYCDPDDLVKDPYLVLDTDKNGDLIFFEKWGSLKHIPKHEREYLLEVLRSASEGECEFDECDVVFFTFITSRIYSAVSQRYSHKGRKLFVNCFICDIFNDVVLEYLDLRRKGLSRREIFSWRQVGDGQYKNIVESKLIEQYLDFLKYQKQYEISFVSIDDITFSGSS